MAHSTTVSWIATAWDWFSGLTGNNLTSGGLWAGLRSCVQVFLKSIYGSKLHA